MNRQFTKGIALNVVWYFKKPNGEAFSLGGHQHILKGRNSRGSFEIESFVVNNTEGFVSFALTEDMQTATGFYSFSIDLYKNGSLYNSVCFNNAIELIHGTAFSQAFQENNGDAPTAAIFSVGEFDIFSPTVPLAGSDGYWYWNGERIKDDEGNDVPTNFTLDIITEGENTGRIILNQGRETEQIIDNLKVALQAGSSTSDLSVATIDSGDFVIADANGNILVEFKDGHIKTKEFNSRNISSGGSSSTSDLSVATIDSGDFVIADANGNILVEFKDGHIKTKKFNSRNISSGGSGTGMSYAERPSGGIENFSVKVNYKNTYDAIGTAVDEVEDDGNSIYDDYCVIGLPNNYSPSGTPVRLIIHCGGTGERIDATTNPLSYHGWSYFLAKGFAVLDCNGVAPDYWSNVRHSTSYRKNHYGCKFLLQSYKKAYDYVMSKYNIAKDGCFVAGISMGGLASFMIVQSGMFPVLAQAGFCPCIDLFKQNFLKPWDDNVSGTAIDYGFDEKRSNETNKEWFLRNIDKTIGWNSMTKNTIGDKTNLWTCCGDNGDEVTEEGIYNGLSKIYPCPLKIWHCKNDGVVLYRYSKYMVTMIRNAGGTAELHSFTSGGHNGGWETGTVQDTDANMSTSINFYEAIKFFERYS